MFNLSKGGIYSNVIIPAFIRLLHCKAPPNTYSVADAEIKEEKIILGTEENVVDRKLREINDGKF